VAKKFTQNKQNFLFLKQLYFGKCQTAMSEKIFNFGAKIDI